MSLSGPGAKGRKTRFKKLLIGLILLVVVGVGSLWTGIPQEILATRLAERALGTPVQIEWGGFLGDLRLDALRVYGRPDDVDSGAPFLEATDIRVEYALSLGDGLRIGAVTIGSLSINADGQDPENLNYGFVQALLEAEPSDEESAYLPNRFTFNDLRIACTFPTAHFVLGGLRVEGAIESSDSMEVTVRGDHVSASWWIDSSQHEHDLAEGKLDVAAAVAEGEVRMQFSAQAPDLIEVKGNGFLSLDGESQIYELDIDSLSLYGERIAYIAQQFVPVTTKFEYASVSECRIRGDLGSGTWPLVEARASIEGLAVGDPGRRVRQAKVDVTVMLDGEPEGRGEARLVFSDGQELNASFAAERDAVRVEVLIDSWSKAEFLDLLPEAFRPSVEELGFAAVSGVFDGEWISPNFDVRMNLESHATASSSSESFFIALDARGSTDERATLEGEFEARLGEELIEATAYYGAEGEYRVDILIGEVGLGPWMDFVSPDLLPEDTSATIGGTIHATSPRAGEPLVVTTALVISSFRMGDAALDRIDVNGSIGLSADLREVTIGRFEAVADDYVTVLLLEDWSYNVDTRQGSGHVTGALDLGLVAAVAGLPDLYGEVKFDADVRVDSDNVEAPLTFVSHYLGYGDLALPYGSEIDGRARLGYALDTTEGTLHDLHMTLGGGTILRAPATRFSLSPFSAHGEIELESDMQVLVDLGWFQEVEGKAIERSIFDLSEEGLSTNWYVSFDVAHLVLPENAAFISDGRFTAEGTYDGALHGTGEGRVSKLSAAGGTVHAVAGEAIFDGTRMIFPSASGRLFEGATTSRLEVGLLEEGFPVVLKTEFEDIDLAVLSEEVQPPNTKLTGKSSGLLEVSYSLDGLEGFYLNANSDDDLSVNRDLIEELLQTEKLLSGMSARVAEKAMDKLLGDAPQRPFDSGMLYVYLTDSGIEGLMELKSEKTKDYNGLNLTVNLDIDLPALTASLRLLEESAMAEMEF